jgi:hypothetical protein
MSGIIDIVTSFFESMTDSFAVIPLLIMGLIFFLGVLTSNIGMLYLLLGQLFFVPALSFAANVPGSLFSFLFGAGPQMTGLKWIVSAVVVFTIASVSLSLQTGSEGFSLYTGLIWTSLLQFFNPELTILDTYNPILLFSKFYGSTEEKKEGNGIPIACSLVPGMKQDEWDKNQRASPTAWLIHICFLFGFIVSNAIAVYNEPAPTIKSSTNPDQLKARQAALDGRVSHRKSLSVAIAVIAILVFILMLYLRISRTPCEGELLSLIIPVLISFFIGYGWFYTIYKQCGVRPADTLGIVQGFVTPDMADNPIVCLGSDSE